MELEERIEKQLNEVDVERLEHYLRMFDRILLYNVATHLAPEEVIESAISIWDTVVKRGIDQECNRRTTFLETTPEGRAALMKKEPDGEDVRMHHLKAHNLATDLIQLNLKSSRGDGGDDSSVNH